MLCVFVVKGAAFPKIVVRREQRPIREPDDAGAAEVGLCFCALKLDFVEVHRFPFN